MKMTRKILPALAMLIVSAVMTTTASFAWFAMSTNVTANNMQVNVKSDSVALVILAENTSLTATKDATTVRTGANKSTIAPGVAFGGDTVITDDDYDVFPSAYEGVANGSDFKTVGKWYTASSADTVTGAIDSNSKKALTTYDEYVIRYKYYVTLSVGSNAIEALNVSSVSITAADGGNIDAVRAVVACGNTYVEFDKNDTTNSTNLLAANLTSNDVVEIYVYVYYDGNASVVNTENVANLGAANISFTLTGTVASGT